MNHHAQTQYHSKNLETIKIEHQFHGLVNSWFPQCQEQVVERTFKLSNYPTVSKWKKLGLPFLGKLWFLVINLLMFYSLCFFFLFFFTVTLMRADLCRLCGSGFRQVVLMGLEVFNCRVICCHENVLDSLSVTLSLNNVHFESQIMRNIGLIFRPS